MGVDALNVCRSALPDLDEDTLEYVSGGVVDEEGLPLPKEDILEFVVPMLAEVCDGDEDEAEALATILFNKLVLGAGGHLAESSTSNSDAGPQVLAAPVMLNEGWAELKQAEAARLRAEHEKRIGKTNDDLANNKRAKDDQDTKEVARRDADRMKRAKVAHAIALSLANDLQAARETAAYARIRGGALPQLGTVELGPFTLPNPGGGDDLIENGILTLVPGHRYGLIGRNGKGKSTLLKFVAARRCGGLDPALSVHYVSQDVQVPPDMEDSPAVALVIAADVERTLLMTEAAALEARGELDGAAQVRLQEVHERLEVTKADTAEERASKMLSNLGFTTELKERPLKALSGGWRVRAALAAALFAAPDVLLLDEPTNHLSIAAVLWLSRELAENPLWGSRVVVVVSHDRYFLDEATTDSIHISGAARRLRQHRMAYSKWADKRKEQQIALQRRIALREDKIKALQAYAGHGFKYGGSSTQINMMTRKAAEAKKLESEGEDEKANEADLAEDEDLPMTLQGGGLLDQAIVRLEQAAFGYPGGKELFHDVDMTITSKSRICLLGENGEGKTTLVKLLLGDLAPTAGIVAPNHGARIALVNQHHADQLTLDATPLGFLLERFPGDGSAQHENNVRSHLAGCGVPATQQTVVNGALSGGQRSRVAMAAVSFARPHLLILDEPTNNLDTEAVAALCETVNAFKGGVLLVSHDQYFVRNVVGCEIYAVAKQRVTRMESFDYYTKLVNKTLSSSS